MTNPSKLKDHPEWIKGKLTEDAIANTKSFAEFLADSVGKHGEQVVTLTTSQLRKFFGSVKKLQLTLYGSDPNTPFDKSELIMLKPKLAYAVGRTRKNNERKTLRIEDFEKEISLAIDYVQDGDINSFKNFINYFESIVAYHKRYGKDN